MRLLKPSTLCQVLCLSLLSLPTLAAEQPDAESLVGHKYLGVHGMTLRADNDRLFTADPNSSLDNGSGFGAELGYRVSPHFEARLSATSLNIDTEEKGYDVPSGSSIAMELLYFPYKSSLYTVFGADFLDLEKSDLSGNIGAGYRYYLSDNTAIYLEGKGHYQIDDNYMDFSTKLGFVYYFDKQPAPIRRTEAVKSAPAKVASVALKDSDQDGVSDANDKCPNSPKQYKVDRLGCTVYMKQKQTIELMVNFDNDKSEVKEESMVEIAQVADFLKQYRQVQVTIHGHTSAQGKAAYNQKLSEKRAQAIVDILVNDFAIAKNRLTAVGHGEEQLLNTANTAEAHAENRRIEATMTAGKKLPVKR